MVVRIVDGAVREIIPTAATAPNVTHWYGEDFAAECVNAPDNVRQGWTYDGTTFSPPVVASAPEVDLAALQEAKQAENNAAFAAFLAEHPLTFVDGKQYGVTKDDQSEIALNLTLYQTATAAGVPAGLEWHAAHEACVPWTLENLTTLLLMIGGYVYPYYHQNQAVKVAIYATNTPEELAAITISYV
jgi:hypothetical protein